MQFKRKKLVTYILFGLSCVLIATVTGFWNSDYPGKIGFGVAASATVVVASIPYVALSTGVSSTGRAMSVAFLIALVPYSIALYCMAVAISRMS